ncbi:hypothetical protein NUW54_g3149 [Trametes sanguinea]|uniref:Uncharacterized protein n=1 Tax=Trametes sanguinea TaxID=158606 RepID=A0ACC1Q1K0_9APHY|nr:hypothetical protein NUW54_g3149 [Trametes sanguinea]
MPTVHDKHSACSNIEGNSLNTNLVLVEEGQDSRTLASRNERPIVIAAPAPAPTDVGEEPPMSATAVAGHGGRCFLFLLPSHRPKSPVSATMVRPRVFFDVSIDNQPAGRIIFELFNDTAPKTCEKYVFVRMLLSVTAAGSRFSVRIAFAHCVLARKGLSPLSERPLYYKNSIVHRSIKDFMIQGGDFTKRNGTGGESIYGGPFPDEDLSRPLDAPGLLCMANKGPNTNNSQFFVTLRDCPHLNGKHVVFGRVIRGFEVIQRIAEVPTDEKDRPRVPVVIANCGELMLRSQAQPKQPEPRSASESVSGSDSEDERRHRKKRRHRSSSPERSRSRSPRDRGRSPSRSRSPSRPRDSSEERDRKKHKSHKKSKKDKKHKSKKHKKSHSVRSRSRSRSRSPARARSLSRSRSEPVSETESQYDARLEREEKERIEAARKRELERIARKLKEEEERRAKESGGVRFKGRGRMKYLDPELQRERH